MKILMVCLGNICRSPLAEGILEQRAKQEGLNWIIESAGTNSYHTDEAPHHLSQKIATKNGINICHQKARTFIKEDVEKYDKIFAMAKDVLLDIKRISKEKYDPKKISLLLENDADVPDPWYSNDENAYQQVYELIDKACNHLIEQYKSISINT